MNLSSDPEKELLIQAEPPNCSTEEEEEEEEEESRGVGGSEVRGHAPCEDSSRLSEAEREERQRARRKLQGAAALTLLFVVAEVIGGVAAHSLAIMTEAAHLLTDLGSILISLFSLWISSRPPTATMTFGWFRAEILGVLLSVVSIWALTATLLVSAVQRIQDGDYDIDSRIMLMTSGGAVGINVLMVLILHQSGAAHGHGHGHGHSTNDQQGGAECRSRHGNASVRAAFIHVVGDLVQSVGVLVAAAIIHLWPHYKVADPICTFLFSVLVLGTTFPVARDVLRILMEGAPRDVSAGAVRTSLLSVGGVTDVHCLHVWSLNMNSSALSVHVVTDEGADSQSVVTTATQLLRSHFTLCSVTIQVERPAATRAEPN